MLNHFCCTVDTTKLCKMNEKSDCWYSERAKRVYKKKAYKKNKTYLNKCFQQQAERVFEVFVIFEISQLFTCRKTILFIVNSIRESHAI